ncbi:hypothetical protein, partial [Thiolapillus sp.]|uniref:hypothetical protein n=1 Tax=Thiolapillus sp. TaxID=2017437 RepID=UPI003AF46EDC
MSKHIIQYHMPFVHEIRIGIKADSEEEALRISREQLESGQELPVNNPLYPVLRDTLREAENGSSRWAPQQVRIVLAFSVCRLVSHRCRNILSVLSHHHTPH